MTPDFIFTSESVTEGHPDKLCDQISDAIIDRYLQHDPLACIRVESAVANGVLFIACGFNSEAHLDLGEIARHVITECGYVEGDFNARDCTILTSMMDQSSRYDQMTDFTQLSDAEINRYTVKNQVTQFGYACNQTDALMPMPIWLARKLAIFLGSSATRNKLNYLLADGKTQVSVEYRNNQPSRIHAINIIAAQHEHSDVTVEQLHDNIHKHVIDKAFSNSPLQLDQQSHIHINADGPIIGGGPALHSGLTGRKTAIDTYGEYARHSGAALSGKCPIRIDRIAAYAARHAAKNIVAAGLAAECEVLLSYSVGQAEPVSIQVNTNGSGQVDDIKLTRTLSELFDFRLGGIIRDFNLQHLSSLNKGSFYRELARFGHMGRDDIDCPWEELNKVDELKKLG